MACTLARADEAASLKTVVERILGEVPEILLDAAGKRALLNAVPALPDALARGALGLEFHLQGPTSAELFLAAVPSARSGSLLHHSLVGGAWGQNPAVTRLADVLREWRDAESWFARSCTFLLLGLDVTAGPEGWAPAPAPSAYLAPRAAVPGGAPSAAAANAFRADPFGMLSALSTLASVPLGYRTCADLKTLLESLPPGAEMFSAGTVMSRERPPARRVAFRHFPGSAVGPFLKRGNRNRAAKALGRVAKALDAAAADMCVAVDVSPEGADAAELRIAGIDWTRLLDALVDRKLADPARVDAALGFIAGVDGGSSVGLRHVKVTAIANTLASTKVCVGFGGR